MEAFVTRKRPRSPPAGKSSVTDQEEDSTELKLAILASLHPDLPEFILLDALLGASGDVEAATANLSETTDVPTSACKRPRFSVGYQSSLSTALAQGTSLSGDNITAEPKVLTKKGRTLHLFSPIDVEQHTPCSIIHNFLPAAQADALLRELVAEAPTYLRSKFQLFERTVESPHTFAFYVADEESADAQRNEYFYNGSAVPDVRCLLPEMRRAAPLVDDAVNAEVQRRIRNFYPGGKKLKHQSMQRFEGNAAFVNVYDGGGESVGYHADELTYLGPRAVIGSLSLGVAREFRVRRIVPRDRTKKDMLKAGSGSHLATTRTYGWEEGADVQGQIAIHLPHNSLLVMHAEMQEGWKHSIAPTTSIDPHPIAGAKRVNITYRHYRGDMHPRHTPRCRCGVPVTLRCAMRSEASRGRYFWQCHVDNKPGEKGCGFFEWAEFDDDGNPPWVKRRDQSQGKGACQ